MTILHSCCFWRSVRKGTYASVTYTLTYFTISFVSISLFLQENEMYLRGQIDKPLGESFLERDTITSTTVIFNILLLTCAALGIISSILVIIGLRTDKREFLLPWILVMIANLVVESTHFVYLIIFEKLTFEPLTATLFTIDFFIMCLNIYCLLCVISQYQEYRAGRGAAPINLLPTTDSVHYVPPTTTCLNNIRPNKHTLSPVTCQHTNCSLFGESQCSPNGTNGHLKTVDTSTKYQREHHVARKHVKFPEPSMICCTTDPNGNGHVIMIDTLPEYSEDILSWQDQNPCSSRE